MADNVKMEKIAHSSIFCYYDKVDKIYLSRTLIIHTSARAVSRGYLEWFRSDKSLNPKSFALYKLGDINLETGEIFPAKEEISPTLCYDGIADTDGEKVSL